MDLLSVGPEPADPIACLDLHFSGDRAGVSSLTWGQRAIYDTIDWLGENASFLNLERLVDVPDECSTDAALDALARLIRRHEALRTYYRRSGDNPEQVVLETGHLPVTVHPFAATDRDAAAAIAFRLAATPFHAERELPLRCALGVDQGRVTRIILVLNHLSADAWAANRVAAELTEILAGRPLSETTPQPVDLVHFERDGHGAQRGASAKRYWERALRTVPDSIFAGLNRRPEEPRWWRLAIESPAAAVAARELARRHRVTTSCVLLAATSMALGRHVHRDRDRLAMQLIVANRFSSEHRRVVAPMTQDGLFAVDVGDSLDQHIAATQRASLDTYRFAYYDPVVVRSLRRDAAAERGSELDLSAYFNDVRMRDDWEGLPDVPVDGGALTDLMERTTISVVGGYAAQDATFMAHTSYRPHACRLSILADTAKLGLSDIEAILHAVEQLLVATATQRGISGGTG